VNEVAEKTWFGQPRGLTILFLTNMWELFSYYGMRALLVFYMTKQLLFAQEKASFIYGAYTAAAYFTPIVGGIVADARFECIEGVIALAAAYPAFAGMELLRAHPEGGAARGAARQDHGTACSGRWPSMRTQPSRVAPTWSAMKGA